MEIWLKQEEKELRLPILPDEMSGNIESNNTMENVNAKGEVTLLGIPNLETYSWSAHFPGLPNSYDQYTGYPTPAECVELIKNMEKKGVVQLIITPYIDTKATIERFDWTMKGAAGDIYYTIDLKQYRVLTAKRTKKAVKKRTVVVKKGDTWASLAKKYTGSSKNAGKIKKANSMQNKKKPPVGKKVTIPQC